MPVRDLHCHGMDCCWDCFAGKPTHPRGGDETDCDWIREDSNLAAEASCPYSKARVSHAGP